MRTENFKRDVVLILLVFAAAFSMISVAPLAHSGDLISDPSSENIEVERGDTFLIRHTLEWNEAENGAYTVTIAWDSYDNEPSENFTFVEASAYFTTGSYVGQSIQADITLDSAPSPDYPGSTRHALSVSCPTDNRDPRNGQFNVDITLSASGVGGVPHIATDNHPILFQVGGIIIVEKYMQFWNRDPITIRVLESILGVEVSISPENKIGAPGENVTFTVTVTNTGNVSDNYDLTVDDNTNWSLTLPETLTDVVPGENRTVNLSVGIPDNAENSTRDNVTVTVTSRADNTVENSASCTAHAVATPPLPERGVQVLISPEDQSGLPEETITFTVTAKNMGEAEDSYDLTVSDNAGWGATLAENLLTIPTGENRTTTVSVTIPSDAADGDSTEITITATSQTDGAVSDSASSTAHAVIVRGVEVSISPSENSGLLGEDVNFTVTVKNTGEAEDTYDITVSDNADWSPTLSQNSLTNVENGASRTVTLTITISSDAADGDSTRITVTATSRGDSTKSDTAACTATAEVAAGGFPIVYPVVAVVIIVVIIAAVLIRKPF